MVNNKILLAFCCVCIGIVSAVSGAISHSVTVGGQYEAFEIESASRYTYLTEVNIPVRYSITTDYFGAFVSSGFVSFIPSYVKGTRYMGANQGIADTRIGTYVPLLNKKIIVSANWLLPAGSRALSDGDAAIASAIADRQFDFKYTRFRDGGRVNFSVAGTYPILSNVTLFGALGYYLNIPYDKIGPGDIASINGAATWTFKEVYSLRNDITYAYNFPTDTSGTHFFAMGNSVSWSGLLRKKTGGSTKGELYLFAQYVDNNGTGTMTDDKNSNRSSLGFECSWDFTVYQSLVMTPSVGVLQLLANEYANSTPRFLPDLTRGNLGLKVRYDITPQVSFGGKFDGYLGTQQLLGTTLGLFVTAGVKK